MRSYKLAPVLAATATMLALAPTSTLANSHQRHAAISTKCHVSLNAAPRFIESGESALVFGVVLCPGGTSVSSQPVPIYQHSAGTTGWSTAGTPITDVTGHFQLTTPALLTNSAFYATAVGAQSGHRTVRVSPKVTLSGPPDGSQLFTGRGAAIHSGLHTSSAVTFSGTVSPADAGALVVLQRENALGGEEWRRIGLGLVAPGGTYSIRHTFVVPGAASIRVVVRPFRLNARGASEPLSYEISQAQNPALTINSSADPIFFAGAVTISGKLASGAGTPLTLLARTHPKKGFVAVATTTSTTEGAYSFPPQSPSSNTTYRVSGGGKNSAALFQGVKYALTASTSASTVTAGQPFTISGTVTPAVAGHPVYLQVQNASGIGFHPIEIGSVSTTGSYSITHVPFTAGLRKFRIKVPGDPGNQGVASSLFPIEVTPAPPGVLRPEPPSNSTVPKEGKV